MDIWSELKNKSRWQEYLQYKIEKQHLSEQERQELLEYIEGERYLPLLREMEGEEWLPPYPVKREINKSGTLKKRVVYSFEGDMNKVLKMLSYLLYCYDGRFSKGCYSFRRHYGVKDAVKGLQRIPKLSEQYALKVDIHNYFNSIDVPILLEQLEFLRQENAKILELFQKILTADKVCADGKLIKERCGAMAGTPMSPFFANVYLSDMDFFFENRGISYFRYSDDILLFADSREKLEEYRQTLYEKIRQKKLSLNPKKIAMYTPGMPIEFLGFSFVGGQVDLSRATINKMKAKIKRKAHALRRWQNKKGVASDKAAKGFIRAMNCKLYDRGEGTEFSWSRWFFPSLTKVDGLKELDSYIQQYIRYCATGRHYKGNYRISYKQIKEWGYRSLVNEYYQFLKNGKKGGL